jgi:hypothetical protein
MIRRLTFAVSLAVGVGALADIPPDNAAQCSSAKAGAACTTDDGRVGTCVATMVSRPDYSQGVPPKTKQVEMLLCVASASATSAVPLAPVVAGACVLLLVTVLVVARLFSKPGRSATA